MNFEMRQAVLPDYGTDPGLRTDMLLLFLTYATSFTTRYPTDPGEPPATNRAAAEPPAAASQQ